MTVTMHTAPLLRCEEMKKRREQVRTCVVCCFGGGGTPFYMTKPNDFAEYDDACHVQEGKRNV